MTKPILYSFRRCPYAMRARLAISVAGIECELREIVLRDKAEAFLQASPKGTVPVVVAGDTVIEESYDVMRWALGQNDPDGWLSGLARSEALIEQADGPFKSALDKYKYASRYDDVDGTVERENGSVFLRQLDGLLEGQDWLFGDKATLADFAILPFVRQFAHVDLEWFSAQPWPNLIRWLEAFKASDRFLSIMRKYPKWAPGDNVTIFPDQAGNR